MTMSTEADEVVEEHPQRQQQQEVISEPVWLKKQLVLRQEESCDWGEPFMVAEWQNGEEWRSKHGWQGRDLIHDVHAPVRIAEYYVKYGNGGGLPYAMFPEGQERKGGVGTTLTGVVHFTSRAESHKGYCHGGSMCSVLDDVIGWCGFVVTGQCVPWSGFTVQINTQLQKPIRVGSVLLVQATVTKIERRKVYIQATLLDPAGGKNNNVDDDDDDDQEVEPSVHASGEGMVVLNKGILPELATRGSLHSWPSSIEIT